MYEGLIVEPPCTVQLRHSSGYAIIVLGASPYLNGNHIEPYIDNPEKYTYANALPITIALQSGSI